MKIKVLGSAAGGGFPQWNCHCPNCASFRAGEMDAIARTQSSIAISCDDQNWLLINASPDIRAQLAQFPESYPRQGMRDTGIKAVLLIDSQIDHTTGLLSLREGKPLDIYCTDMVKQDLSTGFPLFNILSHYCTVNCHVIPHDGSAFQLKQEGFDDLRFYALALKSKAPPYSLHRNDPHEGDNIGLIVEQISSGRRLFYAPGLGDIEPSIIEAMQSVNCILVDGTFWSNHEMIDLGIGTKTALDMGHLPLGDNGGMLEILRFIDCSQKYLIHINNTNPILNERSPQRQMLYDVGVEVATDGLEIEI